MEELVFGADIVWWRFGGDTALSLDDLGGRLLRTWRSFLLLDFRGTSGGDSSEATTLLVRCS